MQRSFRRQISGWWGLVGALGAWPMLSGCPGTLSPQLLAEETGTGGSAGTGGGAGTGGAGGGSSDCTGGNDGATLITTHCATAACHSTAGANDSGGLDLTVDATIGSRLVGVLSQGTAANYSACVNWPIPYLEKMQNPATGLLIDKITLPAGSTNLCPNGLPMPYGLQPVTATQQGCIKQWAEGLVMAAAQ